MTDDIDRIKSKAAWQALKDSGAIGSKGSLIGSTSLSSSPRTLTSVAYTSAEVFDPDNANQVKMFLEAIEKTDKRMLHLLKADPSNTSQAGIDTTLAPNKVEVLVGAELGDRENKEKREHDLKLAREKTKGSAVIEILKYVVPALGAALLTYLGVKGGS